MSEVKNNPEQDKEKEGFFDGFSGWETAFVVITLLLALCGPIILSQEGFRKLALGQNADEVGGAIGGITAPFLSLIAAFLVYKAFRAQIKANKIVQDQFKIEKYITYSFEIMKLSEKVSKDIYNPCFQKIRDIVSSLYSSDIRRYETINGLNHSSDEVKCFEATLEYVESLINFNRIFIDLISKIKSEKDYSYLKYALIESYLKANYSIHIEEIMRQYNLLYIKEKNGNISFLSTYDKKQIIKSLCNQKSIIEKLLNLNNYVQLDN